MVYAEWIEYGGWGPWQHAAVHVMSGRGFLNHGSDVELYHREFHGWFAIRRAKKHYENWNALINPLRPEYDNYYDFDELYGNV